MGHHPELRSRAREIADLIDGVIAEIGEIPAGERRAALGSEAPELVGDLDKTHSREKRLPDLKGVEQGVVMRFAPNPSGPLHLGHARAALLNDAYVQRYGGRYILRIEDTDPKRIDPDAYRMVPEDIWWLGVRVHEVVYQSDRLELYYRYGRGLIERGGAYVCSCENERFRELKLARTACPCRENGIEENLALFEGEASLRVRTDLAHPDPAMRDFPAFRILNAPMHPRVDAIVYPLMNFSVSVDDHLLGITHVIRGKDHIANTRRQRYIFGYFGWETPAYLHYGRMGIEGVVLSTSQMKHGIRDGIYEGWDDPRLGTLRALARRGIMPEAVRQAVLEIGIGETDISFSWENLYAKNRAIVDPLACRWFFVPDPVRVRVEGAVPVTAKALLHPADEKRGYRTLEFIRDIYLPRSELAQGAGAIRLKDLFNIDPEGWGSGIVRYTGESLAEAREKKTPIIQWLPAEKAAPCILRTPEGDVQGLCEPGVKNEIGNVIQFERVGFARIDGIGDEGIVAYFTHR
jgi:glutamyl-tRNA synthetase